MMRMAREIKPKIVYEIGSDKGGGFYHWCKCLPSVRRAIACEVKGVPYRKVFDANFPDIDFLWLHEISHSDATVDKVSRWVFDKSAVATGIDCLFIDGDKNSYGMDFDRYWPMVNPGGIVFVHDVNDESQRVAFHEMTRCGVGYEIFVDRTEGIEAVERRKAGVPPANGYEGWMRHWEGRSCGFGAIRA